MHFYSVKLLAWTNITSTLLRVLNCPKNKVVFAISCPPSEDPWDEKSLKPSL